ncbi:4-hydroxy-tetrahydrodipicolinate reductase [Acholeplasma granularum]|uniref:4-hydroxy-tetrahydrodipicolinate reductase n=1 Tax=Acholeplasma granularum TaxID=264635 RepID=UPI0004B03C5F|nr:4-hydroxy-tetrahydrodipicolinate reductase [Acholeplasma granularum]
MINIAISGVLGKMGQVLKNEVLDDKTFNFIGGFDKVSELNVYSNINDLKEVDVLIDFSTPKLLQTILDYAKNNKVSLVLATTGYTKSDFKLIDQYSKYIPIFYSANYSVGIYLLTEALKLISKNVDQSYDIEMIDKHHRFKKDAPSGTAIKLYNSINESLEEKRELILGESDNKGIHVHSLRLGNYVGEHQVIFSNLSETLELTHIAHDKAVFAKGALKAAKFIVSKSNGLFGMDDLLG